MPNRDKEIRPERPEAAVEVNANPPSDAVIVADTARVPVDADDMSSAEFVTTDSTSGRVALRYERHETTWHIGPWPPPKVLTEYAQIYPDAPKIIFEDFQAQASHRRALESSVIANKNLLARRGQMIGGALGGIGLIGSLIIAGLGQGAAGFGIALTSLVSLVSLFVYGREEQKKERLEKAKVQEQIKRGDSIEKREGDDRSRVKGDEKPTS